MQSRGTPSLLLLYVGTVATALSILALALTAVVKASTGLDKSGPREKTSLELQIESSREIRRALATRVVPPPLPPITAHLAHDPRTIVAAGPKTATPAMPSQAAMDAMAMDPNAAQRQPDVHYPVIDRQASVF